MTSATDPEEQAAKDWFRALTRRLAGLLGTAGLMLVILLAAVQLQLLHPESRRPAAAAFGLYVLLGGLFAWRRRWAHAAICLGGLLIAAKVLPEAAGLAAERSAERRLAPRNGSPGEGLKPPREVF